MFRLGGGKGLLTQFRDLRGLAHTVQTQSCAYDDSSHGLGTLHNYLKISLKINLKGSNNRNRYLLNFKI